MHNEVLFHQQVASELAARYDRPNVERPDGWREVLAWHWEQAGAYAEAIDCLMTVAEEYAARLDFVVARQQSRRALELMDRSERSVREARLLRAYTLVLTVLEFGGQYREGLDYGRWMLRIAQTQGNHAAEVRALLAIGRMQRMLGQLNEAETTLLEARAKIEDDEPSELESDIRLHLAKVYQLQGRNLEGLQELLLAQEESTQQDDQLRLARVLTALGDMYRILGAGREALAFYLQALKLEQARSSILGQAMINEKLALSLLDSRQLMEASDAIETSLQQRQILGDVVGMARAYSVLGSIAGALGDHQRAIECHEQARTLDEQTQNQRGLRVALLHLGDEMRAIANYDQAETYYHQALRVAQESQDSVAEARILERLGDLYQARGSREIANRAWGQALRIRELLGHADEAAALRERIKHGQFPRDGSMT